MIIIHVLLRNIYIIVATNILFKAKHSFLCYLLPGLLALNVIQSIPFVFNLFFFLSPFSFFFLLILIIMIKSLLLIHSSHLRKSCYCIQQKPTTYGLVIADSVHSLIYFSNSLFVNPIKVSFDFNNGDNR
jgi:hypothetical protein